MSVINQMLKDLDKRQAEQPLGAHSTQVPIATSTRSTTTLIAIVVITIVATLAATYFWQLSNENNRLKRQVSQNMSSAVNVENALAINKKSDIAKDLPDKQSDKKLENKPLLASVANSQQTAKNEQLAQTAENEQQAVNTVIKKTTQTKANVENKVELKTNSDVVPKAKSYISTAKKTLIQEDNVLATNVLVKSTVSEKQTTASIPQPATLSITRRQLTPQQLASQKMKQAEVAMMENDLTKAEHLFEDILLLQPHQHNARKQLAALWFGKQSYQPALNLLSQGIAIAPKSSEFRLMQARIYLKQGGYESALNTLQALPNNENAEYQSLRANVAQQLGKNEIVSAAYKVLTKIQPQVGRWWLGSAIAYDTNSQFNLATQAYKMALAQNNLSTSSTQFAQQRIAQLGE